MSARARLRLLPNGAPGQRLRHPAQHLRDWGTRMLRAVLEETLKGADHLRLGIIAECADRAAACAQRAANAASASVTSGPPVMLRQVRMCAVAVDACKELGERGDDLAAPKPDFGSTGKE